jgi:uncharacterized protein YjgD (DUF1641 family)
VFVKTTKNKGNTSKGRDKNKENTWKSKAKARGIEIKRLKKRNKELTKSRDLWRNKHRSPSIEVPTTESEGRKKAKGHQFVLSIVLLVTELQKYGSMSLRGSRHCLASMLMYLGTTGRIPSHTSIRNWVCKSGYYRVQTSSNGHGEQILYVDESIVFGSDKILLILGITRSSIPKDRSVKHSDIEVLYVGVNKEWQSEAIEAELETIRQKRGVSYIVSDEGTNLRKAYKAGNFVHIEDCTHILANHLKRIYGQDVLFESFRKLIGQLRKKYYLSKEKSGYMPPSMRGKLRFANIFPCVNWAEKCLVKWDTLSPIIQKDLAFLKENEAFIQELVEIEKAFKGTCEILKNKGFGAQQKAEIEAQLLLLKKTKNVQTLSGNIDQYLDNLTQKSAQIKEPFLLCCSDIIESYFGKFKQKINPNSKAGLTEFIFTIANFNKPFTQEELKNALEKVQIADLIKFKSTQK